MTAIDSSDNDSIDNDDDNDDDDDDDDDDDGGSVSGNDSPSDGVGRQHYSGHTCLAPSQVPHLTCFWK